jgi:DNA-binding MarR family transcriptional regulator
MPPKTTAIKAKEKKAANPDAIKDFIACLRTCQKVDSAFPLQYAICLTEISLDEGLSLTELAERCSLALSTTSRIVGALSSHRQSGDAYGLVQVNICQRERRRKELYLTARGRSFINNISDILS